MRKSILLALAVCLLLSGCGFANNMTGRVVRGAPNMVLNGAF